MLRQRRWVALPFVHCFLHIVMANLCSEQILRPASHEVRLRSCLSASFQAIHTCLPAVSGLRSPSSRRTNGTCQLSGCFRQNDSWTRRRTEQVPIMNGLKRGIAVNCNTARIKASETASCIPPIVFYTILSPHAHHNLQWGVLVQGRVGHLHLAESLLPSLWATRQ